MPDERDLPFVWGEARIALLPPPPSPFATPAADPVPVPARAPIDMAALAVQFEKWAQSWVDMGANYTINADAVRSRNGRIGHATDLQEFASLCAEEADRLRQAAQALRMHLPPVKGRGGKR